MKRAIGSLRRLFRARSWHGPATALYGAIVEQSRLPVFYDSHAVPDTLDGRFDMIVLHSFLVISRLKDGGQDGADLAQKVFDLMFEDMDRGLRILGSSDVRVGKRIKAMGQAFYGRVQAYEAGLAGGGDALAEAVRRNVFRGAEGAEAAAMAIADYVRREAAALARLEMAGLLAGRLGFGPPPGGGAAAPAGKD